METETEARRKRARSEAEEDEIAVSDTRHAGVGEPRGGSVGAAIADEDEVAGYSEDGEGLRVCSLHVIVAPPCSLLRFSDLARRCLPSDLLLHCSLGR